MSTDLTLDTEQRIFEAAKRVFVTKGMDGARMQDIADAAGINKSMLHYYYRSKEKLFERVFAERIAVHNARILQVLGAPIGIREKLSMMVEVQFEVIGEDSHLILFLLTEMNRNANIVNNLLVINGIDEAIASLKTQMVQEALDGKINPQVQPEEVLLDVLAMIEFPVIAAPLLHKILFAGDIAEYQRLLATRKRHILYVLNRILTP